MELHDIKAQLKWNNPFIASAFLTLMYYISLHPISGFIGGLYFFLVGWIIPDMLIFLVSYGIAINISKRTTTRIPVIIFTSLLLLFFVNAEPLVKYYTAKSINTGYDVTQSVALKTIFTFNTTEANGIHNAYPNPLSTQFIVGSDEGCMCMYFKKNSKETYFNDLKKHISIHANTKTTYSLSDHKDSTFAISFLKSDEVQNTYDLLFEIKEDGKTVSKFWQRGIPDIVVNEQNYRRDDRLEKDFFKNTTELLLRKTFLSSIASKGLSPSYFPSKEFEEFLKKAILVPSNRRN